MNRFFAIILDRGNGTYRDAITKYVESRFPGAYWHFMDDLWIIPSVPVETKTFDIFQDLEHMEEVEDADFIIMAFDGEPAYSGYCQVAAWKWLEEFTAGRARQ
jgi:hypothetical protein